MSILKIYLLFAVLFCGILAGCVVSTDDEDGINSIRVEITMRTSFVRLRVKEVGAIDWVYNRSGTYEEGVYVVNFSSPLDETKRYDVQLVDNEGKTATKWNVILSDGGTVEFVQSDFDDERQYEIHSIFVYNNTEISFHSIRFGLSSAGSWTHIINTDITALSIKQIQNITPPLDTRNTYDMQLRTTQGLQLDKTGVSLTQNGTVVFSLE